jgi:hypothetical protein
MDYFGGHIAAYCRKLTFREAPVVGDKVSSGERRVMDFL